MTSCPREVAEMWVVAVRVPLDILKTCSQSSSKQRKRSQMSESAAQSTMESISSLSGKVAFITGASDGMGKATAFFLSSLGVDVVLCARRKDLLEQYAAQIRNQFRTDPIALSLDVTKVEEINRAVEEAARKFGMIHFVCNFAGYTAAYGMKKFRALTQDDLMKEEV